MRAWLIRRIYRFAHLELDALVELCLMVNREIACRVIDEELARRRAELDEAKRRLERGDLS